MRTYRNEFFVRKDHGFYDLGITGVVGYDLVFLYELLRRFVWRSEDSGSKTLKSKLKSGKLIARVSQKNLGALMGIQRQHVYPKVEKLRKLGWIQTETEVTHLGTEMHYILGERVSDSMGGTHEAFFADAQCIKIWEAVEESAKSRGYARLMDLPVEERVKLVSEILTPLLKKADKGGGTESVQGENGISSGGVTPKGCSEEEQSLEEENEELRTLAGGPSLASLASASSLASLAPSASLPSLHSNPRVPSTGEAEEGEQTGQTYGLKRKVPRRAAPFRGTVLDLEGDDEAEEVVTEPEPAEEVERSGADLLKVIANAKAAGAAAKEAALKKKLTKEAKLSNLQGKPPSKDMKTLMVMWEYEFKKAFPDTTMAAWDGKERGIAYKLLEKYKKPELVQAGIKYIITNWDKLSKRLKKTGFPTIGLLLACHDQLIPEAEVWMKVASTVTEWNDFMKSNPDVFLVPEDLQSRYNDALATLKKLGLA